MRSVLFLLISCLLLSNVANAAMMCCVDMEKEKAQTEQVSEMPCHNSYDTSNPDHHQNADNERQCECQGCAQFSNLVKPAPRILVTALPTEFFYYNNFISSDPDSIYYPPKPIS